MIHGKMCIRDRTVKMSDREMEEIRAGMTSSTKPVSSKTSRYDDYDDDEDEEDCEDDIDDDEDDDCLLYTSSNDHADGRRAGYGGYVV